MRLAAAAQLRRAFHAWGVALEQHQWSFGPSVVRHLWRGRLGWGMTWPEVLRLSLQMQVDPGGSPRPFFEANAAMLQPGHRTGHWRFEA